MTNSSYPHFWNCKGKKVIWSYLKHLIWTSLKHCIYFNFFKILDYNVNAQYEIKRKSCKIKKLNHNILKISEVLTPPQLSPSPTLPSKIQWNHPSYESFLMLTELQVLMGYSSMKVSWLSPVPLICTADPIDYILCFYTSNLIFLCYFKSSYDFPTGLYCGQLIIHIYGTIKIYLDSLKLKTKKQKQLRSKAKVSIINSVHH